MWTVRDTVDCDGHYGLYRELLELPGTVDCAGHCGLYQTLWTVPDTSGADPGGMGGIYPPQ